MHMPFTNTSDATRLARFSALFASAPVGLAVSDVTGALVEVNAAFADLVGYGVDELRGRQINELSGDAFTDENGRVIAGIFAGTRDRFTIKKSYRCKDGSTVWARVSGAGVVEDGAIRYCVALVEDITEQMKAESDLRFQAHVLNTVDQAVVVTDIAGKLVYWNRYAETLFQWTGQAVLNESYWHLAYPELGREDQDRFDRASAGNAIEPRERMLQRLDGTRFLALITPSPFYDERGAPAGIVAIITDITERRQLEQQLRQSQKLEAIGQLAGGIAHDFNNILTVISGRAEFLRAATPATADWREDVDEVLEGASRASSLTRQLLAFSRKQMMQPRSLALDDVVRDLAPMLQRLIGEDIELVMRFAESSGIVNADPSQLEQVLVNLVVNARDAMPMGGVLDISTRLEHLPPRSAAAVDRDIPGGDYTVLGVKDSGVGMDAQTSSHVFEPFFTTKEPGYGTGLGLSTVYGIAKQSGGFVTVQSAQGVGTTFDVFLPAASAVTQRESRTVAAALDPRGTETILLVEDSDPVRRIAERVLRQNGYHVLTARNGTEALQLAVGYVSRIHLLLTDVVMPRISGRQLSEALAAQRTGMRTLFMSGYTDDVILRKGLNLPGVAFMEKPFSAAALVQKVRALLDDVSSSAKSNPPLAASRSARPPRPV
jgi:two-component system, cell cycle sensor histidine kinase and response regulator CckA